MKQPLAPEEIEKLKHSHIRSFSTRRGRITQAQERALADLLPKYEIAYEREVKIEPEKIFDKQQPLVFEIGCGMGETTCAIAEEHPEINFLGCEIFPSGLGATAMLIEQKQLKNVRLIRHDAVEVIRDMIKDDSFDGVHIFFPDPWRKARHHKRRLISDSFVEMLVPKIKKGGYIHCATDWENYSTQMLEVLGRSEQLKNLHEGFSSVQANPLTARPLTKFNKRGNTLGHGCWDLIFAKK